METIVALVGKSKIRDINIPAITEKVEKITENMKVEDKEEDISKEEYAGKTRKAEESNNPIDLAEITTNIEERSIINKIIALVFIPFIFAIS